MHRVDNGVYNILGFQLPLHAIFQNLLCSFWSKFLSFRVISLSKPVGVEEDSAARTQRGGPMGWLGSQSSIVSLSLSIYGGL